MSSEGWTTNIAATTYLKTTKLTCNEVMLGGFFVTGPGKWFKRKITLPAHKRVRIRFKAIAVDSWDNEFFIVKADNTEILKVKFLHTTGSNICGWAGYKDRSSILEAAFDHTALEMELMFTSTLNEHNKNESFGLKNLEVAYCDIGDCKFGRPPAEK